MMRTYVRTRLALHDRSPCGVGRFRAAVERLACARSTYVVKPYDTLWSIASRYYGGDPREGVWKIRERNHLAGTVIRVGERLVMP